MAKKQKKILNVAQKMTQKQLPNKLFYFDSTRGHIWPLINVELSKTKQCGCGEIVGDATSTNSILNHFEADLSQCFDNLNDAYGARALYRLEQQKQEFLRQFNGYRHPNSDRIRQFKAYPRIVYVVLVEEFEIEEGGEETAATLKLSDFRNALKYSDKIIKRIVDEKFPTLIDYEASDEE